MKNKPKILFISGSPRNGNTNFLLSTIYKSVDTPHKELISLKDKDIKFCKGCPTCYSNSKCAIKDDMENILTKMVNSDILVIGTPNYFDNVSGLMKNFIDRCHPLYQNGLLNGKKVIFIFVGGGLSNWTKKVLNLSFSGFVKYLKLNLVGSFSFQASDPPELSKKNITKDISKIVKTIESL